MSRLVGKRFDADQGEVWEGVSECLASAGAPSDTMAYADYVGSRASDLRDLTSGFQTVDDQHGFVAAIGDEVVGVEAVGDPVSAREWREMAAGD